MRPRWGSKGRRRSTPHPPGSPLRLRNGVALGPQRQRRMAARRLSWLARGMGDPGSPHGVPCGVVAQGKKVDWRHCGTGDRGAAVVWPDPPIAEAASVRSDRQGSITETWRGSLYRSKSGVMFKGSAAHPGLGTACIVLDVPGRSGVRPLSRSPDDGTGRFRATRRRAACGAEPAPSRA